MRGYAGLDSCAPARGGLFSLRSVRLRATASALLAQPELLAIRRLPWNWRGRAQQTFFSAAHRPANALQAARGLSQTMRGERAHPAGICSQRRGFTVCIYVECVAADPGISSALVFRAYRPANPRNSTALAHRDCARLAHAGPSNDHSNAAWPAFFERSASPVSRIIRFIGVPHSRAGKARYRRQYNQYGKEAQRRQRGCAERLFKLPAMSAAQRVEYPDAGSSRFQWAYRF